MMAVDHRNLMDPLCMFFYLDGRGTFHFRGFVLQNFKQMVVDHHIFVDP